MTDCALFGELTAALSVVGISGYVLTRQIERLGLRLHFTAGLLGSVVALGADSPELSSAVVALVSGHNEVSVGVVLGSNIFNIAGLLGISALIAKSGVVPQRAGLALNGGAALLITVLSSALIMGWLPAWLSFVLVLLVFLPYVVVSSLRESQLEKCHLPDSVRAFLSKAAKAEAGDDVSVEAQRNPGRIPEGGVLLDYLAPIPTLVAVIAGSMVMLERATTVGNRWHVPATVLGTLILATLTGIPNLVASISLARRGHGSAVLSEALNSNSLNLAFGLCLPALFVTPGSPSNVALLALATLLVVTGLALFLSSRRAGLRWRGGLSLLAVYLTFALAAYVISR